MVIRAALLTFPILLIVACVAETSSSSQPTGETVYKNHCKLCHGKQGDAQISGAKDLTISILTLEEVKNMISEGRGAMKAYKDQLSVEEIDAVSAYVFTLRSTE